MARVLDAIERDWRGQWHARGSFDWGEFAQNGTLMTRNMFFDPEAPFYRQYRRLETADQVRDYYLETQMWEPYLNGTLVGLDFGGTDWTDARVIYKRDPKTKVLVAAWPDVDETPYEYIRWLAASEVPDDFVEDEIRGQIQRFVMQKAGSRTFGHSSVWDVAFSEVLDRGHLLYHLAAVNRPAVVQYVRQLAKQYDVKLDLPEDMLSDRE
jgi:hypothetical protein